MHNGLNALTRRTLGAVAVTLVLAANTASADFDFLFGASDANDVNNLTVNSSTALYSGHNQGWWSGGFPNGASNFNYLVGAVDEGEGHSINNFFIFDISGLTAPVSSATLNLQYYDSLSSTGKESLTYSLFDVSTDLALLNSHTAGTNGAIFDDLGSGTNYGSFSISTFLGTAQVLHLDLNGAGLADLNAAITGKAGQFAIGGTLLFTPAPTPTEEPPSVPDSGNTLVLFVLAAAGIWSLRNRKQAA